MDHFKIRAISKSLKSNQLSKEDKEAAITTLINKINIYLKGVRKYNNQESAYEFIQLVDYYAPLLDEMKNTGI